MRCLVTGGAGFIGSHIAEAFLAQGWQVTVLDDLSRGHERNVPKGACLIRADIRSPEAKRTLAEGRFDVLNHHAAQIDVRVSVDQPAHDAAIEDALSSRKSYPVTSTRFRLTCPSSAMTRIFGDMSW